MPVSSRSRRWSAGLQEIGVKQLELARHLEGNVATGFATTRHCLFTRVGDVEFAAPGGPLVSRDFVGPEVGHVGGPHLAVDVADGAAAAVVGATLAEGDAAGGEVQIER